MALATDLNSETIRQTFQAWNAERESLDSGLSESLAALDAYQLQLDGWQQQLARQRDELQTAREQFERDRSVSDKNHAESSAATIDELHSAREKITALTTLLLSRTEELRTLDNRRAEVQTELELSRARERELKAAMDDQKRSTDDERTEWAEELKQLRDVSRTPIGSNCRRRASYGDRAAGSACTSIIRSFANLKWRRPAARESAAGLDRRAVRQVASTTGCRAASPHQAKVDSHDFADAFAKFRSVGFAMVNRGGRGVRFRLRTRLAQRQFAGRRRRDHVLHTPPGLGWCFE